MASKQAEAAKEAAKEAESHNKVASVWKRVAHEASSKEESERLARMREQQALFEENRRTLDHFLLKELSVGEGWAARYAQAREYHAHPEEFALVIRITPIPGPAATRLAALRYIRSAMLTRLLPSMQLVYCSDKQLALHCTQVEVALRSALGCIRMAKEMMVGRFAAARARAGRFAGVTWPSSARTLLRLTPVRLLIFVRPSCATPTPGLQQWNPKLYADVSIGVDCGEIIAFNDHEKEMASSVIGTRNHADFFGEPVDVASKLAVSVAQSGELYASHRFYDRARKKPELKRVMGLLKLERPWTDEDGEDHWIPMLNYSIQAEDAAAAAGEPVLCGRLSIIDADAENDGGLNFLLKVGVTGWLCLCWACQRSLASATHDTRGAVVVTTVPLLASLPHRTSTRRIRLKCRRLCRAS